MNKLDELQGVFGEKLKRIIAEISEEQQNNLEEIRLRTNKPLTILVNDGEFFLTQSGAVTKKTENAYIVQPKDVVETLTLISGYSIYAFEEEIKKGFITIKGGHRIGLCGKTVTEGGLIKTIKHISSLNIRVSHEIRGAADSVMKYIINGNRIKHTIIVSPPRRGKTTMLRDIVRQLSNGVSALGFPGVSVAVVDERSEIAGSYMGVPQNDVGIRTDVLDCCPKALGMEMLLRSMSPECVAVDEIGRKEDIYAIEEILNAGVRLICTVHGESLADIKQKPYLKELIEKQMFETVIILANRAKAGRVEGIYDENLKRKG